MGVVEAAEDEAGLGQAESGAGQPGGRDGAAVVGRQGGVGAVRAGERVVIAYRSADGCDRTPPQVGSPRVGTSATFAFVDALGRPGAWSTPVTISAASPRQPHEDP